MQTDPSKKYRPFPPVALTDRQWPSRVLTTAPRWCSVDLRCGDQALATVATERLQSWNIVPDAQ